eukprot:scaffold1733_cov122-Skeletonema_dohrnii-CCMP3373.AAC.2
MYNQSPGTFYRRELTAPLIPIKDDSEVLYDEESLHERWFDSTSSISDDDSPPDELKAKFRVHRKLLSMIFSKPGGILNAIVFLAYIVVVVLIIADLVQTDSSSDHLLFLIGIICWAIWQIAMGICNFAYVWGGRQGFAWGGLYVNILFCFLQVATIIFFITAFMEGMRDNWHLEKFLLLFLALTTYFDQKIVKPNFRKLNWCYLGVISKEESREKPLPISGISNIILQKVAKNACKAIDISDEAAQTIEQLLEGQRIRKDKKEAIDDWTLTIKKITKAVSFAPFAFYRSKSAITSTQCQNLVCQMIIYLRRYMDDGHIEADETDLHRTAPLSFAEAFWVMTKFSLQVPFSFLLAILPRTTFGFIMAAVLPTFLEQFTNGLTYGDLPAASEAFKVFMILYAVAPFINLLSNFVESSFTTKALDQCRRKMLRSMLKGGTKFDEKNRPGTLGDAFSNQLK